LMNELRIVLEADQEGLERPEYPVASEHLERLLND